MRHTTRRRNGERPGARGTRIDFDWGGCYGQVNANAGFPRQLMAKLHLITYGCQMNEYDSERVAGLLRAQRYELVADERDADLIIVNTCAIREKAEDKVFSKLGELRLLKTLNPELVIGVMGCMAQLHQEAIQRRAPGVDLVFGSPAIARVNDVAGLERIRFTTSNPYNLTPRLIAALRDVPKVCEWFHLPLQSGSDAVLERMNRGYTRARYLELVDTIRDAVPDMAFST